MVSANAADREQERGRDGRDDRAEAEDRYDSADRRRDLAERLDGVADAETVEARVVADANQARPAEDAVARTPTRAPTARRSRGNSGQVRNPARRSERGR